MPRLMSFAIGKPYNAFEKGVLSLYIHRLSWSDPLLESMELLFPMELSSFGVGGAALSHGASFLFGRWSCFFPWRGPPLGSMELLGKSSRKGVMSLSSRRVS